MVEDNFKKNIALYEKAKNKDSGLKAVPLFYLSSLAYKEMLHEKKDNEPTYYYVIDEVDFMKHVLNQAKRDRGDAKGDQKQELGNVFPNKCIS